MLPKPLVPDPHLSRLEHVGVQDLMTPNPVSVRHGITVREAAAFLAGRGIGAAPVVNEAGRAVGVLSRSDVLLAVIAGVDGAPVREVMTPSVIGVRPDATALEACDRMVRHLVRRVFVLDSEGVPVGGGQHHRPTPGAERPVGRAGADGRCRLTAGPDGSD